MQLDPDDGEVEPSVRHSVGEGVPHWEEAQLLEAWKWPLSKIRHQSMRGLGSDAGTPRPTPARGGCTWLTEFFSIKSVGPVVPSHALAAMVTLNPGPGWAVAGRGSPGPQRCGPAPLLEGNTASLGSWSRGSSWLRFPSTRFELAEPPDSTQMFLLFLPWGAGSGGGCSRFCPPPPQSKPWLKNWAPPPRGLSLLPAGEGRMVHGAPEMSSCISADSRGGEGHPRRPVWGACSESGQGDGLAGTRGEGWEGGLARGLWEDSSLDHLVSGTIGWLGKLERKHRDTCSRMLATCVLTDILRFTSKSQADTRGCGSHGAPLGQQDGAMKGTLGAGSVGWEELASDEGTTFGRGRRTWMGCPNIGSTSHQEGSVSRPSQERVPSRHRDVSVTHGVKVVCAAPPPAVYSPKDSPQPNLCE